MYARYSACTNVIRDVLVVANIIPFQVYIRTVQHTACV